MQTRVPEVVSGENPAWTIATFLAETKVDWQQVCALENQWPNNPLRL